MEFRILGALEIRDGGRVLDLPRRKHRALLAFFLLHAGELLSVDRLIEGVWGDGSPANARPSLQNFVSQLRHTLGTDVLLTRPGGYLLDVEPETVDLLRFERLVDESKREVGPERADTLREALALWRGPPLADLAFEPFALPEIPRLEELHTRVQEDLIDVELGLGRHADLISRIEALIAHNPLRERLRGQLMLALYRCDRQAEALAAYHDLRRVLVEELGIEPSPELRELEQAILRQDQSLALPSSAPTPRPERRESRVRATILFGEIAVCATAADPGSAASHGVGARALAEMRAATEYHGGSVGRAAGEELLAVFTGHEDDPLRAARAALQMCRALDGLRAGLEDDRTPRLEVRAAVTTGRLIVAGGYGPSEPDGHAVVLARRLADSAEAGEVLLDMATVTATGAITAEAVEARAVRGEPAPVPAFRLLDAATRAAARPGGAAPLIGRDRELERLDAILEQARAERRCRLAVVVGEAGIGKSRLVAEFAASVGDRASVLEGRCVSYGEGATYLPLRDVVVQAAGDDPRGAIERRLAGDEYAGSVAEQIADLVGRGSGTTSTGESFWAVRRFLEASAAERPLILVFDDLHWAEPTFLDLVEYLQEWSRTAPIVVLGLTRPDLLERRPGWGASAITLPRLADEDVQELVAAIARDVPAESRARIVEVAEGNPLFAEQLVARAEERPDAADSIPPSLEALISSRLDRLAPGERAVLGHAAVVGREFWHGAVLDLADPLDVPSVGRHLLELMRKGLIAPGRSPFPREDGFRFHHVLIRDVAYESVLVELRAVLHERVADWLDSQSPGQDELVGYHLEHAYRCRVLTGPPDRQARRLAADAGDRLAAAGMRAAMRGDIPAAAGLLGRAAPLLPAAEATRRDLLSELGIVFWRGGDVDRAREILSEAAETAAASRDRRAELRARVELANLRLNREPEGGAAELLALASTAIPVFEELGDDRALGRIWFATATVHGSLHCRYEAAERAAQHALDFYRRSGWPPAPCLQELAAALFYGPASVDDGTRRCLEMLEEADLASEANVSIFLAGLEAMRGRFDEARRLAARSTALYEELGWAVTAKTNGAAVAGAIELLADEPGAAEAILSVSCSALTGWRELGHLATQAAFLGEAFYRQTRYEEAARWAGVAAEHAASDDASAQFSWRALRAKVIARDGEIGEAVSCAREAARLAGATDALSQHGDVLLDLAEVLRLGGRSGEASVEVEAARTLFVRKGNTASDARAVRVLDELTGS